MNPKDLVFAGVLVLWRVLWLAASASAEVSRQPTALWAWLSGSADEALAQLDAHREIVTHVSLGGYSVGADLRLTGSPNRTLLTVLKSYDITVHPLIGGGDITTLRALFSNATATRLFAAEAAAEASRLGLGGFNIDFEPYKQGSTYADAILFAEFTDTLAKELHNSGNAKLSIDFFSNLAFWDIGALNATTDVDYLISMDTYVPGNISFTIYDEIARAHISSRKLGVGLCTGTRPAPFTPTGPDPCGTAPWTDDKVEERLAYIFNRPAEDLPALLNLWVLPVPDVWWSALHRWITPK